MDTDQLYYKDKYFKYKLKYVTLKKLRGGGGMLTTLKGLFLKESDEKKEFDPNKIRTYLDSKFKDDIRFKNDTLYNEIINKDIINAIKIIFAITVESAIDEVLKKHFKDENLKNELKKYLINLINNYNQEKRNMNSFDAYYRRKVMFEKILKMISDNDPNLDEHKRLLNIIINNRILEKIETKILSNNYVSLEDAINSLDEVLQKHFPNDKQALKFLIINYDQ
jgi:hypothetical protein